VELRKSQGGKGEDKQHQLRGGKKRVNEWWSLGKHEEMLRISTEEEGVTHLGT